MLKKLKMNTLAESGHSLHLWSETRKFYNPCQQFRNKGIFLISKKNVPKSALPPTKFCSGISTRSKKLATVTKETHRVSIKKTGYTKVTHCLFDMDGTVLDSEIIYHEMIKQICEKYNRKYTKNLQDQMYGETDRKVSLAVVRELKMPISADEFELQLADIAKRQMPSAPLLEGAERLLTHFHDYSIPMALATNSTEQAVRLHATARPKLFGMFHHKVSATDPEVDRGKPHPDIYLLAAARFPDKPHPVKCLVFEDSAIGVEAAREAGMQVVMIPDRRLDRDLTRRATLVINSLLEFKPELFGLPPFDDAPKRPRNNRNKENNPSPS